MTEQSNDQSVNENKFDVSRIIAQLKVWSERLLDLTKNNPLLGVNRSRVSKLLIKTSDTTSIFKTLVIDGEAIKMPLVLIKKKRKKQNKDQITIDEFGSTEIEPEFIIHPGDIEFEAEPLDLHRLLKRIYDNGRSTVEERGVTTLHLTFGILNWSDPLLGESSSPLLLIPCQLENHGPNSNMRLKLLDEELQVNPALEFYLRKKHHIELPTFPEDYSVESLKLFFSQVQNCVTEQGWKVDDKCWLSTFSFETLVIYKDLERMVEIACLNPLIAALSRARILSETIENLGEELDMLEVPQTVPIPVMTADASQLRALTIAQRGKHLVLKGPPGTGKSQTITNLIADAIGKGKKVLFVSAKMAALNVVHDRLSKLGLGRFCLEAHSTKAGKLKIVEELKRTLELSINNDGSLLEEQLEELKRLKFQLNDYVKEIHKVQELLGITIYQAIGKLEKLHKIESLEFESPWTDITGVTRDQLRERLDALQSVALQSEIFDKKSTHPWRGFIVKSETPTTSDGIRKQLLIIKDNFVELSDCLDSLTKLLVPSESEFRLHDLNLLSDVFNILSTSDGLPKRWLSKTENELKDLESLFEIAATKSVEYEELKRSFEKITSLPQKELLTLLSPIKDQFASWTHVINPKFWSWKSSIRKHFLANTDMSYSALCSYLKNISALEAIDVWFDSNKKTLTPYVTNLNFDSELYKKLVIRFRTARQIQSAVSKGILQKPSKEIIEFNSNYSKSAQKILDTINKPELKSAITFIESNWQNGFVNDNNIELSALSSVITRCKNILISMQKMHEWIILQTLIAKCESLGLTDFLCALEKTSAKCAPEMFEKRFFSQWIETLLNTQPLLIEFTGSLHDGKISQFNNLDRNLRVSMLKRIQFSAAEPAKAIISAQNSFGNGGEVGILRRELQKRKRIKPLRKLFREIPHVLQALKPCMLMSPVSVSTFLEPGGISFDLVVFDEASQLPTPQAIPSILRGKQVVVAGDENQLPPTSFFSASTIFEEENELDSSEEFEPLESLLDNCIAIEPVFQENRIVWHYRSKDERLIQFSNSKFYENSLITFPASTTSGEGRGVHLVHTESGTWDRGRSRTNRVEAKRVAEIIVEQFKKYPERSLGVASMNASQKEAIENALDELITNTPELQAFLDINRPEPFFIKSLENVQGDERDTIIICVGYAKTPNGTLSLNFGPLNNDGGWRRLNVLVTRAKWQTILVTSLRSHELSAVNPLNKGAIMLREYIRYAEQHGKLPTDPVSITNDETNDFEDAIATALRDRGLVVDEQVGTSEYRIDLAIRDSRDKNRYVMAVECDGATYHHTKTARDRDILRHEVLRSQGWKIYRVWSTDWFRDREKALKGILTALDVAKRTPIDETVQAPPISHETKDTEEVLSNPAPSERNSAHKRKYKAGTPYQKSTLPNMKRNVKELINTKAVVQLSDIIARIVKFEAPVHKNLVVDRLKEIYRVSRAGANIQRNVNYAIDRASRWSNISNHNGFLYRNGQKIDGFRVPGQGVTRRVGEIPPEEIEKAILYLVEDQFGFAREYLPKAILDIFGLGNNRLESTEVIESAVDRLLETGKLNLNGHTLYLT